MRLYTSGVISLFLSGGIAAIANAQFTSPVNLSQRDGYWDETPSMNLDSGGNMHAVWRSWNDASDITIWYTNNMGGFWRTPVVILSSPNGYGITGPALLITPDQIMHVLYSTGRDWIAWEMTRPVSGGTWTSPQQWSFRGCTFAGVAKDASGGFYTMYNCLDTNGGGLYGRYKPLGGGFGPEQLLRTKESDSIWPQGGWVTAKDNLFYATYYINGTRTPYYRVRQPGLAGTWGPEIQIASRGFASTLSFSPQGEWALTWYDDRQNCSLDFTIYSKFSSDGGATWSAVNTVSTSCWLSRSPSTTYDADGNFYVCYERISWDGGPWDFWTRTRSAGGAWGPDTNVTNNPAACVRAIHRTRSLPWVTTCSTSTRRRRPTSTKTSGSAPIGPSRRSC